MFLGDLELVEELRIIGSWIRAQFGARGVRSWTFLDVGPSVRADRRLEGCPSSHYFKKVFPVRVFSCEDVFLDRLSTLNTMVSSDLTGNAVETVNFCGAGTEGKQLHRGARGSIARSPLFISGFR